MLLTYGHITASMVYRIRMDILLHVWSIGYVWTYYCMYGL